VGVGFAVSNARGARRDRGGPGGLWSAIKEGTGLARSVVEAKEKGAAGTLLGEIGAAYETADGRQVARDKTKDMLRGKKAAEVADAAVGRLREISALVGTKAPAQAPAFTDFLRETAKRVAEAGTEEGFLGFGGETVSEAEKKTLADLDRALGG
jgi:hypothetical protein